MPVCYCKYNPKTDLKKVSPVGALDLKSAFVNNSIPANLEVSPAKFNDIDNPSAISGRVVDVIDAEIQNRELMRHKKSDLEKKD